MRKIRMRSVATVEGNLESATATRIFHRALDRFANIIREVEIGLTDLNGPKGGIDKRCRARLALIPRGTVVVDGLGATFVEALHGAADKARRTLVRRRARRRSKTRAAGLGEKTRKAI